MNLVPEIEASDEQTKTIRQTIRANPELRYEEGKWPAMAS